MQLATDSVVRQTDQTQTDSQGRPDMPIRTAAADLNDDHYMRAAIWLVNMTR